MTEGPPVVDVPAPPDAPDQLIDWAATYGVNARLDDVLIGEDAPPGTFLPGRPGERLSYRDVLLTTPAPRADLRATGQRLLHRMATLTMRAKATAAWLHEHGRDPEDDALARLLQRVRATAEELRGRLDVVWRPPGTFETVGVTLQRLPEPVLIHNEVPLRTDAGAAADPVVLQLLGWDEAPLRLVLRRPDGSTTDAPPTRKESALAALGEALRDPRNADMHAQLAEELLVPAWRHALGALDESLSRLHVKSPAPAQAPAERIAYRVSITANGAVTVDPVVQARGRGGAFSKGARLEWFNLRRRTDLSDADRRVFAAFDDRFARASGAVVSAGLTTAQVFAVLRALVDHPAVFFAGGTLLDVGARLDLRLGRLRLCFGSASEGAVTPKFDLLGVTLSPPEAAQALRDDRHVIHVHQTGAAPQVLLAQITPEAAALVDALAQAPGRFPPEAHDALAIRLEPLQEALDIEFPSEWTRAISPADARIVVRLDALASGALQVQLGVRPVRLGPWFAPGEGPSLVLEGQGRDRHGAKRNVSEERRAAHALVERLGLAAHEEQAAWRWRVPEGDPALHLVASLETLRAEIPCEWADDDNQWRSQGSVGRGNMHMKVADRRDWFAIDGSARIKGAVVPLFQLLAAIREQRRYVAVGARGFARIEDELRAALVRANEFFFERGGSLELAMIGVEAAVALCEREDQIDASPSFAAVRRAMRDADAAPAPDLPPRLHAALRPYQRAGVAWMARLAHWGAGALLADEMGLGKTVQTLSLLHHRRELGPALVVAPTSVVQTWVNEAARFTPALRVHIHRGAERTERLRRAGPGDVYVASYTAAALDEDALMEIEFATLVLDEAQAVKNAATARAKALHRVRAAWRLGLTGTPVENNLSELWSVMRAISPGILGSWDEFRGRYAVPIEKFGDTKRAQALAAALRPFILRRTKTEVARELPARTDLVRFVALSEEERTLYTELRRSLLEELARAKADKDRDASTLRFTLLASITRLRQLCCHPRLVYPRAHAGSTKAAHLIELLGQLRAGGHKTLVFSQFRSFLDLLAPRLAQQGLSVLQLDGTTPAEERAQLVARFQSGDADVFLISLKAGGVGLTLTAADFVIHLDPWWNPAVEDQATSRAHRIGQVRPVTSIKLVAEGTIEEAVLGLHESKRALAAGILEGGEAAAALDTDQLMQLIESGRPRAE